MNYTLAKELKDAGFTQYLEPCIFPKEITKGELRPPELTTDMLYDTRAYVPNLSELIKACGDELWALRQDSGKRWVAKSHELENKYIPYSETPEEAVARLWLAINKKS